ncbi:MAG: hypothetical protein ABJQ34_18680 [Paracoccaceae bacterium]
MKFSRSVTICTAIFCWNLTGLPARSQANEAFAVVEFASKYFLEAGQAPDPTGLLVRQNNELTRNILDRISNVEDGILLLAQDNDKTREFFKFAISGQSDSDEAKALVAVVQAYFIQDEIFSSSVLAEIDQGTYPDQDRLDGLREASARYLPDLAIARRNTAQRSGLLASIVTTSFFVELRARLVSGDVGRLDVIFDELVDYQRQQNDPTVQGSLANIIQELETEASTIRNESFPFILSCSFHGVNSGNLIEYITVSGSETTMFVREAVPLPRAISAYGFDYETLILPPYSRLTMETSPSHAALTGIGDADVYRTHPENPCMKQHGVEMAEQAWIRLVPWKEEWSNAQGRVEEYNAYIEAIFRLRELQVSVDSNVSAAEQIRGRIGEVDDLISLERIVETLHIQRLDQVDLQESFEAAMIIPRNAAIRSFAIALTESRQATERLLRAHDAELANALSQQGDSLLPQALLLLQIARNVVEVDRRYAEAVTRRASDPVIAENDAALALAVKNSVPILSEEIFDEPTIMKLTQNAILSDTIFGAADVRRLLAEYDALGNPQQPSSSELTPHEATLFVIAERMYGRIDSLSNSVTEPEIVLQRRNKSLENAILRPSLTRSLGVAFSILAHHQPISDQQDWNELDALRLVQNEIADRVDKLLELRQPGYQDVLNRVDTSKFSDEFMSACVVSGCWKQR